MIEVTFDPNVREWLGKERKAEFFAAMYVAGELLGLTCGESEEKIPLHVQLTDEPFDWSCGITYGSCEKNVDGDEVRYIITILNTGSWHSMISTLWHEMKHLQQFIDGRIITTHQGIHWEGQVWPDAKGYREYLAQPWEVEAREFQKQTRKFYIKNYGLTQLLIDHWRLFVYYSKTVIRTFAEFVMEARK